MSGPAIKHTELFDFDSYEKSIDEVRQSTIEFTQSIAKATATLTTGFNEAKESLNKYKKEAQTENSVDNFNKLLKTIEDVASEYVNLKYSIDANNKVVIAAGSNLNLLTEEAKELKKAYFGLTEEERKNQEIGGQMIKIIAQQKIAIKDYNDSLKEATKSINIIDGSYSQLSDELNRLRNQLKNMPNAFNASTGAINEQNKEAVELSKRIIQVDSAVKQMDKTMGQFNRNVGNYEAAAISLRQELRSLIAQLAQMKLAGEQNTEAYNKLVNRAGEVKDALMDVTREVKNIGSDTKNIDGVIGLMEGVAGAAAISFVVVILFVFYVV